jgi:RNA polymerase sigma-70 factor (ECF subfamily)
MVDPDGDVLELVRQGNHQDALKLLMGRHGAAVYRYCRAELRDATLADDVHQQVFIEAHRDLSRFSRVSTLRIWLFAIARHRVLDAAKKRRRAQNHFEATEGADTVDPHPSAGETIDDARLLEALVICVEQLDEPTRAAVLLRFQQGFTFEEMSEICGEKAGTLHARVARALPRLRALIEAIIGPLK